MSYEPPSPDNNLLLRQMRGMRQDMHELMEREARVIELLGRLNLRLDEATARTERSLNEIRSDLLLMENRILTAITETRRLSERIDDAGDDPGADA